MEDRTASPAPSPPEGRDRQGGAPLGPWPRLFLPTPGLRTRIVLVVLAGLLPLGVLGLWLARGAERSGEELLRARLEASLLEAVDAAGASWVRHRSELLDLARRPSVRAALRQGRGPSRPGDPEAPAALRQAWDRLADVTAEVGFRDVDGRRVATFARQDGTGGPALPVRLAVYDGVGGAPIGSLEARLRLGSLLADAAWWTRVGGSVLAAFDPRSGNPLLPLSIEPELFARDRFEWQGERWLTVRHELHEPPLRLALAAPVTPFQQPFRRATRRGTVALAFALVGVLLLATLLARRVTGSLGELAGAADAVARGELERRVPEEGADELRRVARAFNSMSENLRNTLRQLSRRESLAAVGEFAASLAHEIRNPLTAARVDLQRAARRADADPEEARLVERALQELSRLAETVDTALRLARSGRVEREPLDLRSPLETALRETEPELRKRGAGLEPPALDEPLPVLGDAGALERLFGNLLSNAAEAAGEGGRVRVRAEADAGRIVVRVEDDGPGIPPELRERVFEPLFSTRSGGTGLGLPVARRIAHAHGAELHLEDAPGGGLAVRIEVPGAGSGPASETPDLSARRSVGSEGARE